MTLTYGLYQSTGYLPVIIERIDDQLSFLLHKNIKKKFPEVSKKYIPTLMTSNNSQKNC